MKKRLFWKLSEKSESFQTVGLALSKLLICLIDFPFLILGIWITKSGTNVYTEISGVLIVAAATISYAALNMKVLVGWGIDIGDGLFHLFYKRAGKFYDDFNSGLIR